MSTHSTQSNRNGNSILREAIVKAFIVSVLTFIIATSLSSQSKNSNQVSRASLFAERGIRVEKSTVFRSHSFIQSSHSLFPNAPLSKRCQIPWQQVNGPFGASVRDIAHSKTGSVYLCSDGGIYRAKSLGSVWEKITIPYGNTYDLSAMFVHPNGSVFVFGRWGIYRSTDDGKSWKVQYDYSDVRNVVTDSLGNMYAASYRAGLLFSNDTGQTWKTIGLADKNLLSVALTAQGKILCGSSNNLYSSADNGVTWDSDKVEEMAIYSIKQCKNGMIFALGDTKLFRSRDDGKTWEGSAANDYLYRLYVDEDDGVYVLGLFYGIEISKDGGDTWKPFTIPEQDLLCMHLFGKDTIGVGWFGGIFLTTDNGTSWSPHDSGLVSSYIGSITETRRGDIIVSGEKNLYKTSDNGEHWNSIYHSSWYPLIMAMDSAGAMYAMDMSGVIKSTDNGETWTKLNLSVDPFYVSTMTVKGTKTVLAGSSYGDIYRSTDGGKTWNLVFTDNRRDFIVGLTLDKNGSLYCGTLTSIFKSIDDGASWQEIGKGSLQSLVTQIYSCANSLFVGTTNNGIYRSIDGGLTLKSSNNVLKNEDIRGITSDRNGSLYVSTSFGVYKSTDMGDQWEPVGEGLHLYVCNRVFVSSKGYIFLGTQQDGLYRSASPVFQIDPSLTDGTYQLFPNYPNPFNPSTSITFTISKESFVTLKVYDVIGREVSTIISEELPPGIYIRQWQASGHPSGVYFYRLQVGGYSDTKRMVLLR